MQAINGHLALTHAYYAPDTDLMQEGITVKEWKKNYKKKCDKAPVPPSNYGGYAYDAVWTYAYALDKLLRENQSYISNLHTDTATE
jgi:ABC-type branched-subunit amino acid transport system substrate-binding protein